VADINVQVSSAGLTAYGASDWGSQTYGGDQSTSTTLGSADAFNNEGWGRLSWNSLVWGQDFENQTVQVTTPGKGTLWGEDVWGDASWGQISGMDTDQGSAELTVSVDVQIDTTVTGPADIGMNTGTDGVVAGTSHLEEVTGEEATSTTGDAFGGETNVVQVTSPSNDPWGNTLVGWGNGLWGVGDGVTLLGNAVVNAQADANVSVTGEQLQSGTDGAVLGVSILIEAATNTQLDFTIGNYFAGEVVEVQVTTASAIPWGETAWGDGFWGNGVGTDIAIGADAVLTPSIDVPVTGEQLDWTIGNETVTGDANVTLTGNEVTIALGDEDAFTNVTVQVTGNNIGPIVIGDFLAGISQLVVPTGVTATVSTGIMGINAWAVIEPNASTTWSVVDKAAA
jgi:hypothetical protein